MRRAHITEVAKKKPVVEVRGNRLCIAAGEKKAPREFRCMFDICGQAQKRKAAKRGK